MRIFADDLSVPDFRWLIEHAGWHVLPVPPGEDVQGLDVRQWIGKDGVILSAYPIPRGSDSEVFGTVELESAPEWAKATDLKCQITVDELMENLGLKVGRDGAFRVLNDHLDEVRSYLESDHFARTALRRHMAYVQAQYEVERGTLRELRPEIGTFRMIRRLVRSIVSERRQLARYRQAWSSLKDPLT